MTDTATIPETHQPLAGDMLEHLRSADSWGVLQRPASAGTFPARVLAARRALKALERDLARVRTSPGHSGDSSAALLELRANSRLLRSAVRAVADKQEVVAPPTRGVFYSL